MRRIELWTAAMLLTLGATVLAAGATARALDQSLPELKFQNVSFGDAIDFLRDVSGANIHVNWRALEAAGVSKDSGINARLRAVTMRKALSLILSEAGAGVALTYYVDQGVIEITTKDLADKELFTRVYPVEDLLMDTGHFQPPPSFNLQSVTANGTTGGNSGNGSNSNSNSNTGLFSNSSSSSSSSSTSAAADKTQRADALVKLIRDTIQPDIWRENGGPASITYFNGNLVITAPRSVHEAIGGPID